MKKLLTILIFLNILVFACTSYAKESAEKPEVVFFYSSHCEECFHIKSTFFPHLKEKYGDKISWKEINIDDSPGNLEQALSMVLGSKKTGTLAPSVTIGKTVLIGSSEIESKLDQSIESALLIAGSHHTKYSQVDIVSMYKNISLLTILGSGLVDGINPCAFAVIAFFIAIMSVYKYTKRNVIIIGSFYCMAVFITYLLIGIGLFNFIYTVSFYKITGFFHLGIGVLCFLFASLSIYDYFQYKKSGEAKDLILTLPESIKRKMNRIMGSTLRENKRPLISLAIAAFSVGVIVSVLEMACTGQIYLPTLVYIMKNTDYKLGAFLYILFYNLMFILPLIVILILFLLGVESETFNSFLKRHVGALKLMLASIFIALGIGILWIR